MEKSVVCQNVDEQGNPCLKIITYEDKFCSNCGNKVDKKLVDENCGTMNLSNKVFTQVNLTNIKSQCFVDHINLKNNGMNSSDIDFLTFKSSLVFIESNNFLEKADFENKNIIQDTNMDIKENEIIKDESQDSFNLNTSMVINDNSIENNNIKIYQTDVKIFEKKQYKKSIKTSIEDNFTNESENADFKQQNFDIYSATNFVVKNVTTLVNNNFELNESQDSIDKDTSNAINNYSTNDSNINIYETDVNILEHKQLKKFVETTIEDNFINQSEIADLKQHKIIISPETNIKVKNITNGENTIFKLNKKNDPKNINSDLFKEANIIYKKEKSTDCDSAWIPLLCVHG